MEHSQHLHRDFPWRTATVVVGAVAAVELVALIGLGATRLAATVRPHTARPAHQVLAVQPKTPAAHVRRIAAAPPHPLRARSRLSVLVLNGNGVNGAAGRESATLQTLGYGASRSADAPRHDYARTMVLYVPGYAPEARRLRRDAGAGLVAPVDGIRKADLMGSQLVVVLGGR